MTANNGGTPPRVVITGMGALTPLGHTVEATWQSLVAGRSGIDHITKFDTSDLRVTFAGEVRDFDPGQYMDRKEARRLDPCIQYALAAAQQAIADAALDLEAEDPTLIGVIIGSGIGGIGSFRDNIELTQMKGLRKVSPFMVPNMLVDSPGGRRSSRPGPGRARPRAADRRRPPPAGRRCPARPSAAHAPAAQLHAARHSRFCVAATPT